MCCHLAIGAWTKICPPITCACLRLLKCVLRDHNSNNRTHSGNVCCCTYIVNNYYHKCRSFSRLYMTLFRHQTCTFLAWKSRQIFSFSLQWPGGSTRWLGLLSIGFDRSDAAGMLCRRCTHRASCAFVRSMQLWVQRHKFVVALVLYAVLLVAIAIYNSRGFRAWLRRNRLFWLAAGNHMTRMLPSGWVDNAALWKPFSVVVLTICVKDLDVLE